jgi:hypothetical protein
VISKIVETIIKERIQKQVIETQNTKQRGFTSGSSPINSALPVEEEPSVYRRSPLDIPFFPCDYE